MRGRRISAASARETARSSANPLREYASDCASVYFEWPFVAALEVVVTARTDDELMARLAPVLDDFHREMKTTWTRSLVEAGYDAAVADEELTLTLNLIRGMAVNRIWQRDDATISRSSTGGASSGPGTSDTALTAMRPAAQTLR